MEVSEGEGESCDEHGLTIFAFMDDELCEGPRHASMGKNLPSDKEETGETSLTFKMEMQNG